MLAVALAVAFAATPPVAEPHPETLELAEIILGPGCAPMLLADKRHAFHEAQATCDTLIGMRLVDEILDGAPRTPRIALLERLLDDLADPKRGARSFKNAPASVLLRGYRILLLAGLARVDGASPERTREFDELAAGLADDLLLARGRGHWLESFKSGRWPCDSALAAAGLVLHARLRSGADGVDAELIERTEREGRQLATRLATLLPSFPAKVDGKGRIIEPEPRGVTLAWTAAFLGVAGLREGTAFARVLVDDMCDRDAPFPGLAACREWPRGNNRGPDDVSGPIIMGYGTGASALAVPATRIAKLEEWTAGLEKTAAVGGAAGMTAKKHPLERAILMWGETARAW